MLLFFLISWFIFFNFFFIFIFMVIMSDLSEIGFTFMNCFAVLPSLNSSSLEEKFSSSVHRIRTINSWLIWKNIVKSLFYFLRMNDYHVLVFTCVSLPSCDTYAQIVSLLLCASLEMEYVCIRKISLHHINTRHNNRINFYLTRLACFTATTWYFSTFQVFSISIFFSQKA